VNIKNEIKLFGMSISLLERDLGGIESSLGLDLQRQGEDTKDEDYCPQFSHTLRREAAEMSRHYELFYCLEKSIRDLVAETLESIHGEHWWDQRVLENIRKNAQANIQKEIGSGVTPRSEGEIDFTTFGELGEIVRTNWVDFGSMFSSGKAFTKIMTSLNMLRGPIAHCCPLAEDEVVRLRLSVRDWFRLME
jgi:Swt1-like HEPN